MGADSAFVFSQPVAGTVLDDVADILQAEEFEHFIDIAAFMSVEVEADPLGILVCAGGAGTRFIS